MKRAILILMLILISGCTHIETYKSVSECSQNSDCVKNDCCHSTSCVLVSQKPDCSDSFCTADCAEGTLDCGQGSCVCSEGKCLAEFN